MRMFQRTLSCAALLFFALVICHGCSGTITGSSGSPAWVSAPQDHPDYPDGRYLCQVGTATLGEDRGESESDADKRAMAQLASYFRTKLVSVVESEIRVVDYKTNEVHWRESLQKVLTSVSATTDEELAAASVVARHIDEEKGLIHSLAALDRGRFGAAMNERARGMAATLKALLEEAERTREKDALGAFLIVKQARAKAAELTTLREKFNLGALSSAAWSGPGRGELAELEVQLIRDYLRAVTFSLHLAATADGEALDADFFEERLTKHLTDWGFLVQKTAPALRQLTGEQIAASSTEELRQAAGPAVPLLLHGKIATRRSSTFKQPGGDMTIHFYKTSAHLTFLNLLSGEEVAGVTFKDSEETKVGSTSAVEASARSLELTLSILGERLTSGL